MHFYYKFLVIFSLFAFANGIKGQNLDSLYIHKVKTINSTIESLYKVISGDTGVKRNWELFEYLFKPDAKLIPSQRMKDQSIEVYYLSPQDYIQRSGPYLESNGFHEIETHRITENYGNIAHVFSTYAAFKTKKDEEPFMTGINSIQLFYDNHRWWILNVYWQAASEENVIPERYLGK